MSKRYGTAVTRRDVAALAGVAEVTVARVFLGQGNVSPATRDKVLEAAKSLDYRPNLIASSLRSAKTRQIGLIVFNFRNPVFAEIAEGLGAVASSSGYSVLLTGLNQELDTVVAALRQRMIDAVVVTSGFSIEKFQPILDAGIHIISTMNVSPHDERISWVMPDYTNGVVAALSHLKELGHTKITLLSGNEPSDVDHRYQAWYRGLNAFGMEFFNVINGDYTYRSGASALPDIMQDVSKGVTAVISANDFMALGLIDAARKRGISIPDTFSVLGHDDIWLSAESHPSLTTIRIQPEVIGRTAGELAVSLIEGGEPRVIKVDTGFVIRDSTGLAPNN